MNKIFLPVFSILMSPLNLAQGCFSEEEIKEFNLDVKYDKILNLYTYNLLGENHGGQNKNFYSYIIYSPNSELAYLYAYFEYEGKDEMGLREVLVNIDGEELLFEPDDPEDPVDDIYVDIIDKGGLSYYRETFPMHLDYEYKWEYIDFLGDNFKKAENVTIEFIGSYFNKKFKLTPTEVEATEKIVSLYMEKKPEEDY